MLLGAITEALALVRMSTTKGISSYTTKDVVFEKQEISRHLHPDVTMNLRT
jgi:hypothetical protein